MEKKHTHPPRGRGFTLVELVLVVAIVGVVSAVAVPRFNNANVRYKLDAAIRRIAADIELAQQEAIASSSSRTLTFNATTKTYTITGTGAALPSGATYTVDLSLPPYEMTSASSAVGGDATVAIKFDGYGKPNGNATVLIKIKSDKRTISLNGETGKVTIQ